MCFEKATEAFAKLSDRPIENDISNFMPVLEGYVVLLYHKTSNLSDVNSCRRDFFAMAEQSIIYCQHVRPCSSTSKDLHILVGT